MNSVAVAIMCKTPATGASKTRLSPPLLPVECAVLSSCFIRDLASTIAQLAADGGVSPYAVYTPVGSETELARLLPDQFRLAAQCEGDLGVRLSCAIADLLGAGHEGAILVNSDSPTLPREILQQAVDAVRSGGNVTLSPALDGGYTLIGLSSVHARLFEEIPWSTAAVYRLTLERAREIGLPVQNVPGWYDVDDASSLQMLENELRGKPPDLAGATHGGSARAGAMQGISMPVGAFAPATRRYLLERRSRWACGNDRT